MTGDRAVSDTIAFTLTFAVIISSVGLVSVVGLDSVEEIRNHAQRDSAQASMTGFTTIMADVREDRIPRRTVRLALEGDGLYLRDSSIRIDVGLDNESYANETVAVQSLARQTGQDVEMVYASGGAFRVQEGRPLVLQEPPIRCGPDSAHVSLVALEGSIGLSGGDSVTMYITHLETRTVHPNVTDADYPGAQNVTVNVTGTQYREGWETQFESALGGWSGSNGVYRCAGVDAVTVHVSRIGLRTIS